MIGRMRKGALGAMAALALLAGCGPAPARDPATLKAIKAEALAMMADPPAETFVLVAEHRWPHAIAGLRPNFVTVDQSGLDIVIQPYFDGGWGYFVPRDPHQSLQPEGRFSALGEGVYWYHPY